MIKLMSIVEQIQQEQLDEAGVKDIALGAAMTAASMFGGGKAQAQTSPIKQLANQPAITQTVSTVKTNPNFWVKDTSDIKDIQTLFKAYRWWTLAQWKRDKAIISDTTKFYSQLTPQERKTIESRYMKDAPETKEDGKNGQYTSKFIFPGAFLKDLSSGNIENLGIEGNNALQIVNNVGLSIDQMKDWNNFVKWMQAKGESGNPEMDHQPHREQVLQQYKGQM